MAIIGSYSSGSTLATRYSTVDELLTQLPDNTANLIDASDVRDSVYSLWAYVEEVEQVASQSSTGTAYYTNNTQVPVAIGGISAGMSFSGTYSMQQMWDMLLYPYISPSVSISGGTSKEYGSPLTLSLPWTVTKNSNSITSIVLSASVGSSVSPASYVPTGNSQAGTALGTGTHSTSPGVSSTNTFTITVSDATSTPSSTTTLTWMNKRYWGYIDLSSLGTIDLSSNPSQASLVSSFINMTSNPNTITNLAGAGISPGNELSTSRSKTYSGINGGGYHLAFAFPTSFGTPTFTVNGLPNTAFTKVKSNSALKNLFGFSGTNYDVWISNTAQNSPLNIVIS